MCTRRHRTLQLNSQTCHVAINYLLCHLRSQTPLGQAMENFVCTYQLWVGQQHPILEDTTLCPWIPDHWLSHLWASMHANTLQVTYNAWTIPALCKHECYLMDDFKDNGIPWFKLEQLNACHMYLQVTTLAEIMDHTGKELFLQIFASHKSHIPKDLSNISTPMAAHPSPLSGLMEPVVQHYLHNLYWLPLWHPTTTMSGSLDNTTWNH